MAAIDDLINQIPDVSLRERIKQEANRLQKNKKFGLVYEEHLPECTLLYGVKIKAGSKVALKSKRINKIFRVEKVEGHNAICNQSGTNATKKIPLEQLISIAEFGDPIYPYLKKIDSVSTAPKSNPWHELIEADNYHALQLLTYVYRGKVDCIYIDPPYNTGAKDWKYNNDYVDANDSFRHSKWLSFMEKRLKLAKKLLNSNDSILIVTIDEKEYIHLGLLLEEVFPEARIQMISSMTNKKGSTRVGSFSRRDEYIYFVFLGEASIARSNDDMLNFENKKISSKTIWNSLLRRGADGSSRRENPNLFYPFYVSKGTGKILKIGESLSLNESRNKVVAPDGCRLAWPIRSDGSEGRWQISVDTAKQMLKEGTIKSGRYNKKTNSYAINYLKRGQLNDLKKGILVKTGIDNNGAGIFEYTNQALVNAEPGTIWVKESHDASVYGSTLLKSILPDRKFPFPKSLYAVLDTLRFAVGNKKDATVLDFFAGSGTTLHALNLLNAEDNGHRQCILVTNNEVSINEANSLKKKGIFPGQEKWEKYGIARYITWPRIKCTVLGVDTKNKKLTGNYGTHTTIYKQDTVDTLISKKTGKILKKKFYVKEEKDDYPLISNIKLSDGFKTNVVYFKLGFLDKTFVALGTQFLKLLPVLWMKAGSIGECPSIANDTALPNYMILPKNKFAILLNERNYHEFINKISDDSNIETVFIVTNSDDAYREMISNLEKKETYQLYKDYLDNFRINIRG
ncbi:site-specific DNA-methyltransferase [Lactobacillus helveticus]|uniref:DNA methylase N-4/N-6 domain-containing protein n=1 Tax=Lactobacillus helveticus TaxID=1587 RepID=A0A9Q5BW52_LACHE|nr:DNA methyltransferase [Lactobacillus helveticus]NRN79112.1 hypothetical protein [Lactobacillus helveticus]NRN92032.1 hypothetical protein [Lactobacillus helveticus]NRO10018.1 hypothetical protein [Lactobacillus helveticus]NRO29142.1 hypothetical protein [Lactobacillus helveticus]NRO66018.1 hypothetical protein [Lactobacillus helveticus]